jgi:GT2 family glycosyltransferase
MPDAPADLAIIVVSTNEGRWLDGCITTALDRAGTATLEFVVVDNDSSDGTRELVESRFPEVRVVSSRNRGFAHGNNRGLETTSARYVLFLNPDTEIAAGTFGELIEMLDTRPHVGLVGVRQVMPSGELTPTIRRFPNAARAFGEALASERWPVHPSWAGERVLDATAYEREVDCDWTSGSFMLARREALQSAGFLDERFFIYAEEPDLCLRMKRAGWSVRHLPQMTIIHHAEKGGVRPRMSAQGGFARRQYAHKHFAAPHRTLFLGALAARHGIRALASGLPAGAETSARQEAARQALRAVLGRGEPPFGPPSQTAVRPAEAPRVASGGSGGRSHGRWTQDRTFI